MRNDAALSEQLGLPTIAAALWFVVSTAETTVGLSLFSPMFIQSRTIGCESHNVRIGYIVRKSHFKLNVAL